MSQNRGPLTPDQQRPVDQDANLDEHTGANQDAQQVAQDLPNYTPQGRTDNENPSGEGLAKEGPGFTPGGRDDSV